MELRQRYGRGHGPFDGHQCGLGTRAGARGYEEIEIRRPRETTSWMESASSRARTDSAIPPPPLATCTRSPRASDGFWDGNNSTTFRTPTSRTASTGFQSKQLRELDFETYVEQIAPDPALGMLADARGSDITYSIQLSNLRRRCPERLHRRRASRFDDVRVLRLVGQGVCSGSGNTRAIDFETLAEARSRP